MVQLARLDRVAAEAKKLQFRRALLTLALAPLYTAGWVAGKTWQVIAYVVAAIKVGWREGSGS